ncbi:MAG: hypothetical protein M3353_06640 [Actinomycetota bacterium]|nr:hypothetical protein [Actinomycetota bacterium]
MAEYATLVRSRLSAKERAEVQRVNGLARELVEHLDSSIDLIAALHIHGAQSRAIQGTVGELLERRLGFGSELVLTPQDGLVTRARPDFFFPLGPGRGIVAEVERGGTTANNHDLKDVWKAHIAVNAQHLFLVVPLELHNQSGGVRERPYPKVVRRIGAFFGDPRREIDVLSAHVFGY